MMLGRSSDYELTCSMKFTDLKLKKPLLNALADIGIEAPTSIQEKVFSPIMSGRDVVGVAQTGTGKTFAYLLPSLNLWKFTKSPNPQILIIVPTRELVAQVVLEINKLSTYISLVAVGVYGGTNIRTQKAEVMKGLDVIVGTPGRLVDLMLDGVLKTKYIKRLIIDEVDEMLNLGFRTQLNLILDFLPAKRQNLMFSATLPGPVLDIITAFTDYYTKIEAAPSGAPLENIDQFVYEAPNFNTKANLLELLLDVDRDMHKVLVFVGTKKYADALFTRMETSIGEKVGIIHSSKSQNNRFAAVEGFDSGVVRVLIATDVIARGLDLSDISHVINFGLPDAPEQYIHRIGRTGRVERKGIAISFVAEDELENLEQIEQLMEMTIPRKIVPEELEISKELIELEKTVEFVPFNNHKMRTHKPTGAAFHEKSEKNNKVNVRVSHDDLMKKKYKKQFRKGKS